MTLRPITRIVLADPDAAYRRTLRDFLEKQLRLHVVGEAESGDAALRLAAQLAPDALLIDVTAPRMGGLEATRRIAAEHPAVKVIALSLYADRQFARAALEAGASGFLTKDDAIDRLPRALPAVAFGRVYRGA